MKGTQYQGNSAYCYSNCTSMLLGTIEEDIKPSFIEVIGGVGIGAFVLPDSHIAFLSNFSGLPDQAISRVLKTLGFSFEESFSDDQDGYTQDELKDLISESPTILGPVDMGYLVYNPNHKDDLGIDHYVFATEIIDNKVRLHDPAGYPNVLIDFDNLMEAWKAERIGYKRGFYRYWNNPSRVSKPNQQEIFETVIKSYKTIYKDGEKYGGRKNRRIDSEAILFMADNIEQNSLSEEEWNTLQTFVFKLGARRALDLSNYLEDYDQELSQIKQKQSKLLGTCHYLSVVPDTSKLAKTVREYEELESEFKDLVLKKGLVKNSML